jgi:TonB family protein
MKLFYLQSFLTHFFIAACLALISYIVSGPGMKTVREMEEVILVEEPESIEDLKTVKEIKENMAIKSVNEPLEKQAKEAPAPRQVFGLNRSSQIAGPDEKGIDVKMGNTTAKAQDDLVLNADDPDSLPAPVDEFMVTSMPVVLEEVRPEYPAEAKAQGQFGEVSLDILIDSTGKVRDTQFISGNIIFKNVSVAAIKKFRFRPALVQNQPVAVRIRYTLTFELEY